MKSKFFAIFTEKGFTLLELMVVMFIVATLSAILFASTRGQDELMALNNSARSLAQDLREAEEMAMSSKSFDCLNGCVTRIFGIYAKEDETKYILFAECRYSGGICDPDFVYDDPSTGEPAWKKDKNIRAQSLEKGIKICTITPPANPNDEAHIVFQPPHPIVYLNNSLSGETSIALCLISNPAKIKTVKINIAGRIEIN